ncbi:MAG: hypothetical protein RR728_08865 [Oscillospiraceae bacterium]
MEFTRIMTAYTPTEQEQNLINGLNAAIGGREMFFMQIIGQFVTPYIVVGCIVLFLFIVFKTGFDEAKVKANFLDNAKILVILALVFLIASSWSVWAYAMMGKVA